MMSFYGHLMPWPLAHELRPGDFSRISQAMYSTHSILIGRAGERFTDESLGYYVNAQRLTHHGEGRGLLLGDEWVRREFTRTPPTPSYGTIDRVQNAADAGANVIFAESINALVEGAARLGYDATTTRLTLDGFNAAMSSGVDPSPSRRWNRRPLDEGPYFAVEVQPAITFTMGGLRIATSTEVVDEHGEVVSGLLAAGADGAGVYNEGYAGGLSQALVFGLRAATTACREVA
jgi:succinate dehydrogenase/fumarate reductase flavoprotein subunit